MSGSSLPLILARQWSAISIDEYTQFCQSANVGYSITMDSGWLSRVCSFLDIETRYYGCIHGHELVAAAPVWGSHIAGDWRYLKKHGKTEILDFGQPQMVLPIKHKHRIHLPFQAERITNVKNVKNILIHKHGKMAKVRCLKTEISKKRRRNMDRSIRSSISQGASYVPVDQYSAEEFTDIYCSLHYLRWNKPPKAHERMLNYVRAIKPWLYGYVMCMDNKPVAVELAFKATSARMLCIEYINAGYNPEFSDLSPGSLVSYMNIRSHYEEAEQTGKEACSSFGNFFNNYKTLWCQPEPMYRVYPI